MPRHPRRFLRAAFLPLTVFAFGLGGTAHGQGWTPDPYNIVGEFNRQYLPFMYAAAPTDPGIIPNAGRIGNRGANQFQDYVENLDGEGDVERPFGSARGSGPGTPYYQAYRRFDRDFKRTYRPNADADSTYYESQDRRNEQYFRALSERDPRKRAQRLREYNLDNLRAARSLSRTRTLSEKDRERELDRDRIPGAPDAETDEDALPLNDRRPSASSLIEGRSGAAVGTLRSSPGSSRSRAGVGSIRGSRSTGRSGSASDLLERSDLMERARRATGTGSSAPPPPSSLLP
jgi:hypothetical protein